MLIISTASCTFYSLAVSTQSASIMGGQHNSLPHSYADGRGVRADWRAVCLWQLICVQQVVRADTIVQQIATG